MRLGKEDREETAFTTKYGLFERTVVLFGLAQTPRAFIRMMNKLLAKHRAYYVVYLDDILIHTRRGNIEHRAKVSAVVKTLRDDNWKLATGKCVWGAAAVNFVEFPVNKDGIHVDSAKVKAVVGRPIPMSVREVRAFLGLTGFYRQFVKGGQAFARVNQKGANLPVLGMAIRGYGCIPKHEGFLGNGTSVGLPGAWQ
jgi:hypothetical protein